MKILFIVDQLPHPARNGVTIPTFNYMSRIALKEEVFLLFLKENGKKLNNQQLNDNKAFVKKLWVADRYRKPRFDRIKGELFMHNPYFLGWRYDLNQIKGYLSGYVFDIVWVSPFLACDVIDLLFEVLGSQPIYVAGINDCITAVFRSSLRLLVMKSLNLKTRIIYTLHWLRSWQISRIEVKLLKKYDLIMVQTETDRNWLNFISKDGLDAKIVVLSNGVNEALFNNPISSNNKDILFMGKLTGIYSNNAIWFIKEAWGMIRKSLPSASFFIIGEGASARLRQAISLDKRIIYKEYIPNIKDIYKGKGITIAPVFKNYGTINKVIESMAAGVPVVGDFGCFNGIRGFQNNRHGIVANEATTIVKSVIKLLYSPHQYINIAYSARKLVQRQFAWKDRVKTIRNIFRLLLEKKN